MPSVFSRVTAGGSPARFVWKDPYAVAFLSLTPLIPGHTLVVPRQEVTQWTEADSALLARCVHVAQAVGQGVQRAWNAPRAAMFVIGFEVPHMHIHVAPAWGMADLDLRNVQLEARPAALDLAADRLRTALVGLGYEFAVPPAS